MASLYAHYDTLAVSFLADHVLHVQLNRPQVLNAMNAAFWAEMRDLFTHVAVDTNVRAVVISGAGKHFSAGVDMRPGQQPMGALAAGPGRGSDVARHALKLQQLILSMQESFNVIANCPQPVIAAIHGACIGGAVDLITACDMRFCSDCAKFSVKEVAVGLCADVGTLQRLPRVVGNHSWVRDLCFSARTVKAQEALQFGLVSRVCPGGLEGVLSLAKETAAIIAEHSPLAVTGTKRSLNWSQDRTYGIACGTDAGRSLHGCLSQCIADGLAHVALWNSAALMTKDLLIGAGKPQQSADSSSSSGKAQKRVYSKL